MYELSPTFELEELEGIGESGDWELEDLEALDELDEGGEWEVEAIRRRRGPVRVPRRLRPRIVRRGPVRLARRYGRRPAIRRRPTVLTRPRARPPYARYRPMRPGRRPVFVVPGRPRPVRVVYRDRPVYYPGYYPRPGTAVAICVRPVATLNRFSHNRASLRRHHIPLIRSVAQVVVASWRTGRPVRTIRLVGHADNSGSAGYNRRLGMQRALAIRSRLIHGINRLWPGLTRRIQITARTVGETKPVVSNRTGAGRALNRRVEIFLSQR